MNRIAAEQTISGPGVMVYLMEEMTDARLRCEQLKHYVAEAVDLVSGSEHQDHFWEAAGHLLHGIPETLFKLDKALSAAALAAGKLDYEALKQNIRPEKADELERVLEDARIRYVQRRSGKGTMMDPKTAASSLRSMAHVINRTGSFPLGHVVTLLAALGGKKSVGAASRMASIPVRGSSGLAQGLYSLADQAAAPRPSRARLALGLRRVLLAAISADALALLQSAGGREEVMEGFLKANPELTEAQLVEIADQWEANKDKFKTAGSGSAEDLQKFYAWLKGLVEQYREVRDIIRGARAYAVATDNSPLRKAIDASMDGYVAMVTACDDVKRYGMNYLSRTASVKEAGDDLKRGADDLQNFYTWLIGITGHYRVIRRYVKGARAYAVDTDNIPLRKAIDAVMDGYIAMVEATDNVKRYGVTYLPRTASVRVAAQGDPRWLHAKFSGKAEDGTSFKKGDMILYWPRTKTIMVGKRAEDAWRKFESEIADEDYSTHSASDDRAAALSPALSAFASAFDLAKATWMAAQQGNGHLAATLGLETIASMSSALASVAPEGAGLERIIAIQGDELVEASSQWHCATADGGKFREPAGPSTGSADAAKWKAES